MRARLPGGVSKLILRTMFSSCHLPGRLRILAVGLALGCGATAAHAQKTIASCVQIADSFREVAPAGKATAEVPAQVVRDELSTAEAAAEMEVQLPLRTRNAAELERRVAAGETISREEMSARFLPTEADFRAVADWAASQGLTVEPMGAGRSVVIARGTTAQMAAAFQTRFARVQYKGEEHTSATQVPSLPAAVEARVHGVHGLQPHLHPRKHLTVNPINIANGEPPFLPDDILKAYDIAATGLDGSGQTIGIVIDSVPQTSDIQHYWTYNGVPQDLSRYSTINVNGRLPGARQGEETLDVEWASGIASGANIVVYNCGDLNYSNDAYSRVLDDLQSGAQPGMHQVSISFGAGEITDEYSSDVNAVHGIFTSIAAYGVNIFCSAGDEGAYANATTGGRVQAIYPASDPAAVGVGATSLYLDGNSAIQSETAWSVTSTRNHDSGGGGISVYFDRPSWQKGTGVDMNAARQVPDVALAGDPITGYYVYYNGKVEQDGGTSVAAPCWAALCALLNQARANNGMSSITNINASLYPLLGTSAFHDITVGTDSVYSCTTGYDLLTGLGTPDFAALVTQLNGKATSVAHPAFFTGEAALDNGVYYLSLAGGNYFGYYSYLSDPRYIYHFDLGYEYCFDAGDGKSGAYFYDFTSGHFFYSSPVFPFPYLYDFSLNSVLYYFPNTNATGHYTTNPRYFYNYATGKIITQ